MIKHKEMIKKWCEEIKTPKIRNKENHYFILNNNNTIIFINKNVIINAILYDILNTH